MVLALLAALAAGVAAGWAPHQALPVALAVASAAALLLRLEAAALAVVAAAAFQDYLDAVWPYATDWLLLVLVLAWVVRRAAGPLHERRSLAVLVPAAVLAAVLVLALAAHTNGVDGLRSAGRYAAGLVAFVVLADCLAGPLRPARAVRAFVLSCTAAAACGLVTAAVSGDHRVAGPLSDPDDLALFFVAALPLVAAVGLVRPVPRWARARPGVQPRRHVWAGWTCFVVLALGLVGTQSRGAYVAAVVALAAAAGTRVLSPRSASAVLALAATGAALVLAVLPHPVGDALGDPQRYADTGLEQRADLWHAVARLVADHPALGVGPGGLRDASGATALPGDVVQAHSTLLQAAAELGVLGALALFGVWVVPGVALVRRRRRDRLAAATVVALTGALTAALAETEHHRLPLWLLAALAAALAGEPRRARHPSGQVPQSSDVPRFG